MDFYFFSIKGRYQFVTPYVNSLTRPDIYDVVMNYFQLKYAICIIVIVDDICNYFHKLNNIQFYKLYYAAPKYCRKRVEFYLSDD